MPLFRLHPKAHCGTELGVEEAAKLPEGDAEDGVGEGDPLGIQDPTELPPGRELEAEEQYGRELDGAIKGTLSRR